jgi:hypothetical protein
MTLWNIDFDKYVRCFTFESRTLCRCTTTRRATYLVTINTVAELGARQKDAQTINQALS